jgi:hypothetical protein
MHDRTIEEALRSTLRAEAEALPLTVTVDELERRLALRRRERSNRRVGVLAAGIGAVAVGAVFALAVGPFRGPNVAATPGPSTVPTARPTIAASPPASGLPAKLPELQPSVSAVDSYQAGQFARPGTDSTPETTHLDRVRMDAREAGIKFVCSGPDVAEIAWGYPETAADARTIANETVTCDATVREFRYDIATRQPLIDDQLTVVTSPRVGFRILVETFGSTNDPRPASLVSFATPRGDVLLDVSAQSARAAEPVGTIARRSYYRIAMACLGSGSATWSIGAIGGATYVASGEVACDGAPVGFVAAKGILSSDPSVYVKTASGNEWHIVATSPDTPPFRPVPFTPPAFEMYAGADLEGRPASAPAQCMAVDGSGDSCGIDLDARDGARTIGVPLDSDVGFVIHDGWTITQASVHVANRDEVRTDPSSAESREFATLSDGSGRLTASKGRMTLSLNGLDPGEWILVVSISAEKGRQTFGATYQLPLRISG